jgi:quinoprotein glucose dehydrogenase
VKETYVLYCQSCHGADRAGLASIPSLANLSARMTLEGFKTIVGVGRGQMPGFPHIDEVTIGDLYIHLGDPTGVRNARPGQRGGPDVRPASGAAQPTTGPVVASGGAPGGRQATDTRGTGAARGYPPGVTAPTTRYTTEYGLEFPNLLAPPWSSIAAYDLNEGKIKWKRPLGEDPKLVAQGIRDTGVPNGSQRKGMIVTSTGVLFATCRDGKVYAYDADNGNQLWSTQLPRNTEGLPAMYEAGGRQFLVVGSMAEPIAAATQPTTLQPGYIVYALPLKK